MYRQEWVKRRKKSYTHTSRSIARTQAGEHTYRWWWTVEAKAAKDVNGKRNVQPKTNTRNKKNKNENKWRKNQNDGKAHIGCTVCVCVCVGIAYPFIHIYLSMLEIWVYRYTNFGCLSNLYSSILCVLAFVFETRDNICIRAEDMRYYVMKSSSSLSLYETTPTTPTTPPPPPSTSLSHRCAKERVQKR